MSKKLYSELSFAIDLVSYEYQTSNPIIIAEKIEEDLNIEYTIHQIADYMNINKLEDYEKQSNKIKEYKPLIFTKNDLLKSIPIENSSY